MLFVAWKLKEAGQIHTGLLQENIGRNNALNDMRAIIKTWRNRLPVLADDLSHWSDIFTWRQHHYQAIVSSYEQLEMQNANDNSLQVHQQGSHAMLGMSYSIRIYLIV